MRGLCCRPRCLSIRLYVTIVYCIQTAEDIISLLSRTGSPIILVFFTTSADTQFQSGEKILRFSTEIAVYLRNGAR